MATTTDDSTGIVGLVSLADAQRLILAHVAPLERETVAVEHAAGRVLASSPTAAVDLPPFASSAMDGYAVRAADTPARLSVVGEAAAGRPASREVGLGEAVVIATGGVVPRGADAVVPIEYVVKYDNTTIDVPETPSGAHVRPRGGDVRRGDEVLAAGAARRAADVGARAAAGVARMDCGRRPRAVVLATGSELRAPGQPLGPGEVYDANSTMLAAALARAGAAVERAAAPVADAEREHRVALERALEADVVVTSGGVSVGSHDLVRQIGRELGVEQVFWGVAVKPGKPLWFGVRRRTLVFGLPGNPVSSLVAFELFVRPALAALQGAAAPLPRFRPGRLAAPVRADPHRDVLVRARSRVGGEAIELEPLSGQESHMIVRAAGADALVLVARGSGELRAGSPVSYLPLDLG